MALTLAFNHLQSQTMADYRLENLFSGQEQVMMSQRTQTLFLVPTSVCTQPLIITSASDALFWHLHVPYSPVRTPATPTPIYTRSIIKNQLIKSEEMDQ